MTLSMSTPVAGAADFLEWRSGNSGPRTLRPLGVAAVVAVLALAACNDSVGPPRVATVMVTSDINDIIPTGRGARLTAVAKAASGDAVSVTFTWTSSNPAVATVSTNGTVQGVTAGVATVTAEADGKTGNLALRVVAAELNAVRAVLADPLRRHLVSHLLTTRGAVEGALATADQAVTSGDIVTLNQSLSAVATEASAATNPNDRALLGTLVLLTDFAIRLLHL